MLNWSDSEMRKFLGPSLQTASLRAVAVIGVIALLGSGCTYLLH